MARGLCRLLCLASALGGHAVGSRSSQQVPEFEINLDLRPEERYVEVVKHFNGTIHTFYDLLAGNPVLKSFIHGLTKMRGPEKDEELAGEIRGVAQLANVEEYCIQFVQFLYELQTLMVPWDNATFPWSGPGCLGIVATNKEDGMVYHARNLDFSPKFIMQNLTYTGIATKQGKEVFRCQMQAGYSACVTGMKKGPNGFTMETNTRYPAHPGGDKAMLHNLLTEKRNPNLWTLRKIIENAADYEEAVEMCSNEKLIATQFTVMAGVKKGTILSRSADGVVYKMTLGQPNYHCRDDYIITTNFDYYWHDFKEFFDYTSQRGFGHSRRKAAMRMLNASTSVTQAVLWETIQNYDVQATDTIFQVVMNVESGLWNTTLPSLTKDADEVHSTVDISRPVALLKEWQESSKLSSGIQYI